MILKTTDGFIKKFKLLISAAIEINISTAYFSNQVFETFYDEFLYFYNNGEKFRLIIGIDTKGDEINLLKYIESGSQEEVNKYVVNNIFNNFDNLSEDTLRLIHNLFLSNKLEVRIGYIEGGIYHSKYYIFKEQSEYRVINGSLNLTMSGLFKNFEVIELYTDMNKGIEYNNLFDEVWNNIDDNAKCIRLSEFITKKIEDVCVNNGYGIVKELTSNIDIRPYQQEAIDLLLSNNFNGFFKMATGTGKTFTALNAIHQFSQQKEHNMITHIVVPYLHLAAQWHESIKSMYGDNAYVLECHSELDWKDQFDLIEYEVKQRNVFTIFVVNTYIRNIDFLCSYMSNKTILIVDEAHNLTSENLIRIIDKNMYEHKLGLSATPEHYKEAYRTYLLFDLFSGPLFEYDLKAAIENGFLTRYNYIPILVNLADNEAVRYKELQFELDNIEDEKCITQLLNEKNDILSRASGKMKKLQKLIEDKELERALFYCYPGSVKDDKNTSYINFTGQVIKKVKPRLVLEKITSDESRDKRMKIANNLLERRTDAILAIKCLDEGFDIPAVKEAYILYSTSNPKEYVQRRGRILRLFPGKEITYIYDFIVAIDGEILEVETNRFEEYASLAENQKEINKFRRSNRWEAEDE